MFYKTKSLSILTISEKPHYIHRQGMREHCFTKIVV